MNKNNAKIVLFTTPQKHKKVPVRLDSGTVWLSQKQMAELFGKNTRTVNEHIQNIFRERELGRSSTVRNFRIVQKEGGRDAVRSIEMYNLDVIISVGYRVKSKNGTIFRIY